MNQKGPIRCLQEMLHTIAKATGKCEDITPTGNFCEATKHAVQSFQLTHGLPVTGTADQQTWEAIASAYDYAITEASIAEPILVSMNCGSKYTKGDCCGTVQLAQCMLAQISRHFHCLAEPRYDGNYDISTENAVTDFQRICSLPVDGKLDKTTWKNLVLQYEMSLSYIEHIN